MRHLHGPSRGTTPGVIPLNGFGIDEQVAELTAQLGEARSAGEASSSSSAAEVAALREAQEDLQLRLTAAEAAAASAAEEMAEGRRQAEEYAVSEVEAAQEELRVTTQRLQARSAVTVSSRHERSVRYR